MTDEKVRDAKLRQLALEVEGLAKPLRMLGGGVPPTAHGASLHPQGLRIILAPASWAAASAVFVVREAA